MKRFLADALLIWLIVTLATYLYEANPKVDINEKITEFEDEVARHEIIDQKVETSRLNNIEENHAAKMAEAGSDFVIGVMDKGMNIISEFVYGFMH